MSGDSAGNVWVWEALVGQAGKLREQERQGAGGLAGTGWRLAGSFGQKPVCLWQRFTAWQTSYIPMGISAPDQPAADVTLKERCKLVLVARECPLSTIHLKNMYELSQIGTMILPPVLSYYNNPESLEDATNHIVGKILD